MVKVVVADNHVLFRMGLVAFLKQEPRIEIAGEYKSFSSLQPLIPKLNNHLLVIDISLNKEFGSDVANYIKENNSTIKVIILTSLKEEFHILNAMESEIDAYIHKDSEPEEIMLGINKVLSGEKFYSLEISNLLIGNLYKKNYRGAPFLTTKEKEIIKYLMEGNSSKEIAVRLDCSPRTIDTHRANILGKFNLKNTTELISKISELKIRL
ncbi:MAG TPA: response regulator transcription factor [Ohtaekwangia sp.]